MYTSVTSLYGAILYMNVIIYTKNCSPVPLEICLEFKVILIDSIYKLGTVAYSTIII